MSGQVKTLLRYTAGSCMQVANVMASPAVRTNTPFAFWAASESYLHWSGSPACKIASSINTLKNTVKARCKPLCFSSWPSVHTYACLRAPGLGTYIETMLNGRKHGVKSGVGVCGPGGYETRPLLLVSPSLRCVYARHQPSIYNLCISIAGMRIHVQTHEINTNYHQQAAYTRRRQDDSTHSYYVRPARADLG